MPWGQKRASILRSAIKFHIGWGGHRTLDSGTGVSSETWFVGLLLIKSNRPLGRAEEAFWEHGHLALLFLQFLVLPQSQGLPPGPTGGL